MWQITTRRSENTNTELRSSKHLLFPQNISWYMSCGLLSVLQPMRDASMRRRASGITPGMYGIELVACKATSSSPSELSKKSSRGFEIRGEPRVEPFLQGLYLVLEMRHLIGSLSTTTPPRQSVSTNLGCWCLNSCRTKVVQTRPCTCNKNI